MGVKRKETHEKGVVATRAALFSSAYAVISDRAILQAAVCAYLAAEQGRGTTVGSVVQAVREILANAGKGAVHMSEELAQQLVDSCLEPYVAPGRA